MLKRKLFVIGFTLLLNSCSFQPPFLDGEIVDNKYGNDFFIMDIPKDWEVRKPSGHTILTLQKHLKINGNSSFPTVHLKAGTIRNNSFITHFENLSDLVTGSFDRFANNDIYVTFNKIDTLENNGLIFYFFESKIDNRKFNTPDLLQSHYFFEIDSIYFNLSVSDYDRFDELKYDYKIMLESIIRE